jgi:hypothetical protein
MTGQAERLDAAKDDAVVGQIVEDLGIAFSRLTTALGVRAGLMASCVQGRGVRAGDEGLTA